MSLPLPPDELRALVGPLDPAYYDNPHHYRVFHDLPADGFDLDLIYRRVFDFGCGCGRQARQLMQMATPPEEYVGIDVSRRMVEWCRSNLSPLDGAFSFHHHDVFSAVYAPENSQVRMRPLGFPDGRFTLINAHSVFTHLLEDQAVFYFDEIVGLLDPGGLIRTTWFAMNRAWFPGLHPSQHSIFISTTDPSQAVYYDWGWIAELIASRGLRVAAVQWPLANGQQFPMILTKRADRGEDARSLKPASTVLGF